MKLCKDCAHFDGKHYCLRTARAPDYVYGTPPAHYSAQNEREHDVPDGCAPAARYFKAKPTPADADPF